jgi:WD40 repeat protein
MPVPSLFSVLRAWLVGCAVLACSAAAAYAQIAPPNASTTQPSLRIETGMHTASIRRITVDGANRWLVTASEDKTARVWELAADRSSARLVRVLRPPSGTGNEGKLYAVAISPDGQTIAVGGWTSPDDLVTTSTTTSERLVQQTPDWLDRTHYLIVTSDEGYLAAIQGEMIAVRVYLPNENNYDE